MTWYQRLFNEPVVIGGAIRACLAAAIAFGTRISPEQLATLMVAVEAVLIVITRALVTPNQLAEARVSMGGRPTVPRHDDYRAIVPHPDDDNR